MKEKEDVIDINDVAVGGIEREWRRPSAAGNLKFEVAFGRKQPQV